MAAIFSIDSGLKLVTVRFEGHVTVEDVRGYLLRLSADPRFHKNYSEFVDLTQVETSEVDFTSASELTKIDPFAPYARRAFVASKPAIFGLTRMYQMLRQTEETMRSFENIQDARKWLLG